MAHSATLIYRSQKARVAPAMPKGVTFQIIDTFFGALGIARAYAALYGYSAALKMIAKLATPSRSYYFAQRNNRIVSDGWISAGRCNLYPIGAKDFVIGPIATVASERGQGLAHSCLVRGINYCLKRKANWVYIDTTDDNYASQRTIEKSGMTLEKEISVAAGIPD